MTKGEPTNEKPTRIITRLLKMLTRHGALMEEDTEIPYLTNLDADPALAPLHAAACTYRLAFGPRAGQKVLTRRKGAKASPDPWQRATQTRPAR